MDNRKIAFIICVNNEHLFKECTYYIHRLTVPDGFTTDIIEIREADSMCAAYNAGMKSSDAKYKIYMHQDVMIRNTHFLQRIISIFEENPNVGMIGMMGGTGMPKTGVAYRAWNAGMVDCREPDMAYYMVGAKDMKPEDTIVEAIDGLLMATQYDVLWREDLFTHFDFYDVSQSFEMRKAGYQILVPYQETPWVIHDSGFAKLPYYDGERKKCLHEYPEFFYAENGFEFTYDREWNELSETLAKKVEEFIVMQNWAAVGQIMQSYRSGGRKSSLLESLEILYQIYFKETEANVNCSFFENCLDFESIWEKYSSIRFLLRRMELNLEEEAFSELVHAIRKQQISCEALVEIILHAVVDKKEVLRKVAEIYRAEGIQECYMQCNELLKLVENKPLPVTYCRKREYV